MPLNRKALFARSKASASQIASIARQSIPLARDQNSYCCFTLYSAARVLALVVHLGGPDATEAISDLDVLTFSLSSFSQFLPLAQLFKDQLMADITGFGTFKFERKYDLPISISSESENPNVDSYSTFNSLRVPTICSEERKFNDTPGFAQATNDGSTSVSASATSGSVVDSSTDPLIESSNNPSMFFEQASFTAQNTSVPTLEYFNLYDYAMLTPNQFLR